MEQQIKISVVIPVYNAQAHLEQCLDSVLSQGMEAFEVICVDDGSTDASPELLRGYTRRDGRVRVLCQQNQYAGAARNRGIQAAQGAYIAFLDADDFYLPGALERLYQLAERHQADVVKGSFLILDMSDGRRYTTLFSTNSGIGRRWYRRTCSFRQAPDRLLNAADVPWNGLYRRRFLEERGISFNALRCVNDHSFYIQCLLEAERILFTDARIACYRVEQTGSLVGRKAEHFDDQIRSYGIVRSLCHGVAPDLSRRILRQEFNGVLGWYLYLRPRAVNPEALDGQLVEFLRDFDEADVGEDYLRTFSFRELYYGMRYGTAAPGRRPAPPVRMVRCWREHGWHYTLERMFARETRRAYELDSGD